MPTFLQELPHYCNELGIDPQWNKWHVLLADERCVVETHADSNLGLVRSKFTNHVSIISLNLRCAAKGVLLEYDYTC